MAREGRGSGGRGSGQARAGRAGRDRHEPRAGGSGQPATLCHDSKRGIVRQCSGGACQLATNGFLGTDRSIDSARRSVKPVMPTPLSNADRSVVPTDEASHVSHVPADGAASTSLDPTRARCVVMRAVQQSRCRATARGTRKLSETCKAPPFRAEAEVKTAGHRCATPRADA